MDTRWEKMRKVGKATPRSERGKRKTSHWGFFKGSAAAAVMTPRLGEAQNENFILKTKNSDVWS
jgi:hypothetical protein